MLDGAMARERGGGTRFGAVLDATCDRIGDGAIFCGLLWWAAFGMHSTSLVVATMICLVTSQVISYIKARAEASGLRGDGGLIERPERLIIVLVGAGLSGVPFLHVPWLLPSRCGCSRCASLVTVGQRLHPCGLRPARWSRCEGRLRRRRQLRRRTRRRASRDQHPDGTQSDWRRRFSLGGQLSDLGYAAGWRVVRAMPEFVARNAFDAGALVCGARWRARAAAQEPGPGARRPARRGAGRADPCFAGLLRPILAGGIPIADDGSQDAGSARASSRACGGARTSAPASRPVGVRSWRCRTAATGTWPVSGWSSTYGTFTTVAERLKPESLYQRFVDYRESLGFEVLPLTGGERPPFEVLVERLRDNRSSA